MKHTYRADAADGKAMTLTEIRDFVASLDGADGAAIPKVRVTFGGGIKRIEVEVDE